jgi:thioredoxin 1
MNPNLKLAIAVALMMVVGGFVVLRQGGASFCCPGVSAHRSWDDNGESEEPVPALAPSELPRLVELGSTTCAPCQMMKPIIEEITVEYEGRLEVVFVDVQKDLDTAQQFNIRVIPTQIFLDADGKELYRNEGMLSKQEILDKWAELGIPLQPQES